MDVDDNTVNAVNYFDLTLAQSIPVGDGEIEIYGSVDNLFDLQAPRAPLPSGPTLDSLGVSNSVHDLVGRYFRVGARIKF